MGINKKKKTEIKLQKLQPKYLRRLVGVTCNDHVRNDDIRKELNVKSIIQKVEEQQFHWLGMNG